MRKLKPEPVWLQTNALILDSSANIHIIDNPNFLSCIRSCIDQWINATGSCSKCKLTGRLCVALKPLPLPDSAYIYHPNGIDNIISLFLLSDLHRITMDTDMENAFYVHKWRDGSYMKYKQCPTINLYMYVIEEGKENNALMHSIVEEESNKFYQIDQTRAKVIREMQQVLASQSNYDLANTIENNVVPATPFTRGNSGSLTLSTVVMLQV